MILAGNGDIAHAIASSLQLDSLHPKNLSYALENTISGSRGGPVLSQA
jgi:hypothetical protein